MAIMLTINVSAEGWSESDWEGIASPEKAITVRIPNSKLEKHTVNGEADFHFDVDVAGEDEREFVYKGTVRVIHSENDLDLVLLGSNDIELEPTFKYKEEINKEAYMINVYHIEENSGVVNTTMPFDFTVKSQVEGEVRVELDIDVKYASSEENEGPITPLGEKSGMLASSKDFERQPSFLDSYGMPMAVGAGVLIIVGFILSWKK